MKKPSFKNPSSRPLTLAVIAISMTVTAATVTLGFTDDLVMDSLGVGTLKGAVQFGQSHLTFPKDNSTRVLPNIVQDRAALFLYFPHASDGLIGTLTVTATLNGKPLGTLALNSPAQLPTSDQVNVTDKKVEYSTKAWSVRLPWNWQKPGLMLKLRSNTGLEQSIGDIEFSAPSEMVLQHIRIGMLTPPTSPTAMEVTPELVAADYFQKIPISKLVISQYNPIHLTQVTLANGTVYNTASNSTGGVYSGDMREQIGKSLISTGINLANYGLSSSAGTSQSQPGYFMQVVAHHSVGMYANGVQQHGLSGGNGMATLYETSGNEFSHELGHNYGLGHYPNGFAGSVHTRTTGWGFDAAHQRMIGNTNTQASSDTFVDGQPIDTFADRPYGKDAMAGGFPMGAVSKYTQHTGYVAAVIQKAFESYGVINSASPSGYVKWNAASQKMETLVDANRRKPNYVGGAVATMVGFYDPVRQLKSVIYPPMYGSYGVTYSNETVTLDANKTQCKLVVTGANASTFTQRLHGSRLNKNEMNKFHINLKADMLPASMAVQCNANNAWVTLATANVEKPATAWPKATIVGGEAGYGALANSKITIASIVGSQVPLRSSEQLRDIIRGQLGPIQTWSATDQNAMAGSVFEYANPSNGKLDYYILKKNGSYGYFPTNQISNNTWAFIGSDEGIVNLKPNPFDIRQQNAGTADESISRYYGKKLLSWTGSQTGVVGDIYAYDNSYTGLREYFQLKRQRYGYFPTSAVSSSDWAYLGNSNEIIAYKLTGDLNGFENKAKAWYGISSFNVWGSYQNKGTPGSIYEYNNPYTGRKDYFQLKTSSYWYFPTNMKSNHHWTYLVTY